MGRMDCASSYHFNHCQWSSDMRHEEDVGEQKGEEEEDSGERRDERRQLLST